LQVGLGRDEPTGGSDRLLERGSNAPIGFHRRQQDIGVGVDELVHGSPAEHGGDHRMPVLQLLEDLGVHRVPGLRPPDHRQSKLLEQHLTELPVTPRVEPPSRQPGDDPGEFGPLTLQPSPDALQHR
jgi:hypothetical protein